MLTPAVKQTHPTCSGTVLVLAASLPGFSKNNKTTKTESRKHQNNKNRITQNTKPKHKTKTPKEQKQASLIITARLDDGTRSLGAVDDRHTTTTRTQCIRQPHHCILHCILQSTAYSNPLHTPSTHCILYAMLTCSALACLASAYTRHQRQHSIHTALRHPLHVWLQDNTTSAPPRLVPSAMARIPSSSSTTAAPPLAHTSHVPVGCQLPIYHLAGALHKTTRHLADHHMPPEHHASTYRRLSRGASSPHWPLGGGPN